MADKSLRETHTAGNGIDFERLANDSLAPLESFHRIIHRDGEVESGNLSGHEISDIIGVLLSHARETILRAGGVAVIALVLTLALASIPTPGHAQELFDSPKSTQAAIDFTLAEGLVSGHHGLTIKAAQFMELGGSPNKDAATRTIMNKAAWLSIVNAHRMLDSLYGGINNPETKAEMKKSLRFLDSGITLIGKRLGWNEAATKAQYAKARGMIEARIVELRKTTFAS